MIINFFDSEDNRCFAGWDFSCDCIHMSKTLFKGIVKFLINSGYKYPSAAIITEEKAHYIHVVKRCVNGNDEIVISVEGDCEACMITRIIRK